MKINKICTKKAIDKHLLEEIVYNIAIFYFLLITGNADFLNNQLLFWSSYFLQIVAVLILLNKFRMYFRNYMFFYFIFTSYVGLSMFWAVNIDYTRVVFITLLEYSIPLLVVSSYVDGKKRFLNVLKLFIYSVLINIGYVILFIGINNLRSKNGLSLDNVWNANSIGLLAAYAFFFLYYLKIHNNSSVYFIGKLNYLLKFFLIFVILLTGSRKALAVVIGYVSIAFVISKKNKFIKCITALICVVIVFIIIMKVPLFYESIGTRIVGLLAKDGIYDASTLIRLEMIEKGIEWIQSKPIVGYGFGNFRSLYYDYLPRTWNDTYSHNNYIELFIGGGIIGVFLYYIRYIYILLLGIKKKSILCTKFILPIVIILFIIEVGFVDYYEYFVQFLVCLCFAALNIEFEPIANTLKYKKYQNRRMKNESQ